METISERYDQLGRLISNRHRNKKDNSQYIDI